MFAPLFTTAAVVLSLTVDTTTALPDIIFSPCAWDLHDHVEAEWKKILPDAPLPDLECAHVPVPLDWSINSPDATYYVRRLSYKNYRQDTTDATSQYWWFTGAVTSLYMYYLI